MNNNHFDNTESKTPAPIRYWNQGKSRIKNLIHKHPRWAGFLLFLLIFDFLAFSYFTERAPYSFFIPQFDDKARQTPITVYLPDHQWIQLVKENRKIFPYQNDREMIEAMFDKLAARPLTVRTFAAVPYGVELKRAWIYQDIVYLNLAKGVRQIELKHQDQEKFFVYGVTRTILDNLPKYEGVKFLIDGKEVDFIWGGVDLSRPLKALQRK